MVHNYDWQGYCAMHSLPPIGSCGPSRMCRKVFKNEGYYGHLPRYSPMKRVEYDLEFVSDFCKTQFCVDVPDDVWRVPEFSYEVSFMELKNYWKNTVMPRPLTKPESRKILRWLYRHYSFVLRNAGIITAEEAVERYTDMNASDRKSVV